jgi:hypothetical protein
MSLLESLGGGGCWCCPSEDPWFFESLLLCLAPPLPPRLAVVDLGDTIGDTLGPPPRIGEVWSGTTVFIILALGDAGGVRAAGASRRAAPPLASAAWRLPLLPGEAGAGMFDSLLPSSSIDELTFARSDKASFSLSLSLSLSSSFLEGSMPAAGAAAPPSSSSFLLPLSRLLPWSSALRRV